jgi:hypothetical protein
MKHSNAVMTKYGPKTCPEIVWCSTDQVLSIQTWFVQKDHLLNGLDHLEKGLKFCPKTRMLDTVDI